jgi:hypothetical protein
VTPYLPYFSNCENSGDYLYFSQMIHNATDCELHGYQSQPINEFSFGSSAVADTCNIIRNCVYDEIPTGSHEYPVWGTLDSTSHYLFYVTALEYPYPYQPVPQTSFDTADLVSCNIVSSQGDNGTSQLPLKTTITLGYYQETEMSRTMLRCEVEFSLYAPSQNNFGYQLEIIFAPMNHTKILLDFGFRWYIYMLVFIMIGLVSNIQFIIFWVYHVFTTVKTKTTFRVLFYLPLVRQILKGVLFASVIAVVLTFLVEVIMNGTFFGIPLSPNFASFWDFLITGNIGALADSNLSNIRSGRMGFSYIIISVYLAYDLSPLMVGKERKRQQYE